MSPVSSFINQGERNGRWGFSFLVPPGYTSLSTGTPVGDLLSVQEDVSRSWTVHLNAMRYAGGSIVSGLDPDNAVDSYFKVGLVWGGNDGSERAFVDYPGRGCTFQLHGSNIRIQLYRSTNSGSVGAPPLVSGWLVDEPRVVTAIAQPTLSLRGTIAAAQLVVQAIPPRAVAYRFYEQSQAGVATTVTQIDAIGTVLMLDYGPSSTTVVAQDQQQTNRAGYRPLDPAAQFLNLQAGPTASSIHCVQYLLDLG